MIRSFLIVASVWSAIVLAPSVIAAQEQQETPRRRAERPQTPPPETSPKLERRVEPADPGPMPRTSDQMIRRPRSTPRPSPPPVTTDDVPVMPRGSWIPGEWSGFEERIVLPCESVRVCALDPLDSYAAWMLSGQTTYPWRTIVDTQVETGAWPETFEALEIRPWEVYAAFDQEIAGARFPSHEMVRRLAQVHLGPVVMPAFRCDYPVTLEGISAEQMDRLAGGTSAPLDWVDEEIATRIVQETGWCRDDLLVARRFLGSWPRVARHLYLSPFLFESSFGIQLAIQNLGTTSRVRYPQEEEIRTIVEADLWPEERMR